MYMSHSVVQSGGSGYPF